MWKKECGCQESSGVLKRPAPKGSQDRLDHARISSAQYYDTNLQAKRVQESKNNWEDQDSATDKVASCSLKEHETCFTSMDPKFEMLKNPYNDCPMLPYIFASQDLSFLETHSTICIQGSNNRNASLSVGENDSEMENTESPDFSFECLTTHSRESMPTIANTRALFPMLRGRKSQILKTRTSSYLETTPWE
ncbi:hypothetical protein RJ641_028211 [Dillenia turbinata]|uniref:Uncharacterized protein n=1 Tax=Dillenia turbinata TaxID=194707 RepID=A0AAN8VYT9_9MAGN